MIRKLWLIFAQAVTVSAGIAVGLITVTDWRPFAPAQEAVHIPDFSSAVERAAPAVVTIFARHATPGKRAEQIGTNWNSLPEEDFNTLGSGVLVSSDGFVLTNYHVVASIQGLYVGLPDSGQAEAVLVGSDPETDLALIKISGESGLPFIGLGDTSKLKVGQSVLAIGNPFDVGQTVTSGIISALGRHGLGLNSYEDFIQTDAAINQGNSGGALVNTEGELIGINTAVYGKGWGIGFAIPINKARRVMDSLLGKARMSPIWLGLQVGDIDQRYAMAMGLNASQGVLVTGVYKNTPAAAAGIEPGDTIQSINGTPLSDRRDYLNLLRNQVEGAKLSIDLCRQQDGGKPTRIEIMPQAFTDAMARDLMRDRWGLDVEEHRAILFVSRVDPNGPARYLRKGDVIESVNGVEVSMEEDMIQAFRNERLSNQVLLVIGRGRQAYYAPIRLQ